jgi:GNAT superfamily N-acetyltransferase
MQTSSEPESSRTQASPRAGATRVTRVQTEHISALAPLLARAFDVDPAYQYLFPEPSQRIAGLTDFFARNLATHLPAACTHALLVAADAVATVTLRPPGGVHISTLTMLRRGLLPFVFAHGHAAVKRLFWLKGTYDALEREASQAQPHWYVHMMAVRPDLQGQGHGSRLLAQVLEQTSDRDPQLPTVLTTHLPENLVFYRGAGFETIGERKLAPPGGEPYTVWSMARSR